MERKKAKYKKVKKGDYQFMLQRYLWTKLMSFKVISKMYIPVKDCQSSHLLLCVFEAAATIKKFSKVLG